MLRSRVEAALATDFRTRDARLTVTADDGIVDVNGQAGWPDGVEAVTLVAQQVEGVKTLRSNASFTSVPRGPDV